MCLHVMSGGCAADFQGDLHLEKMQKFEFHSDARPWLAMPPELEQKLLTFLSVKDK